MVSYSFASAIITLMALAESADAFVSGNIQGAVGSSLASRVTLSSSASANLQSPIMCRRHLGSIANERQSRRRCRSAMSSTALESSLFGALEERVDVDDALGADGRVSRYTNGGLVDNRYSARDWLHNVLSLPQSSVLRDIRNPVLSVMSWGTLVSFVYRFLRTHSNAHLRKLASNVCVSASPHSFLVSALGLLLVFRTNSAYQRFVEGRAIWEHIHSLSRNLSRMVDLYEKEMGTEKKNRIKNMIVAFPYLLRHHIRPHCLNCDKNDIDPENRLLLKEASLEPIQTRHEGDKTHGGTVSLDEFDKAKRTRCWVDRRELPWSLLPSSALKKVSVARNRPLWACDRLAKEIASIPYGPNFTSRERLTMLGQIDKLSNKIGECERIHQTAVPLNYARHSLRSLTLWLFTLPFAVMKDIGIMTGPVVGVTAWLLFGVYQIGYSIEDPFQRSLRLSILCDAIRRDVLEDASSRGSPEQEWEDEDWDSVTQDIARQTFDYLPHVRLQDSGHLSREAAAAAAALIDTPRVQVDIRSP